MGSLWDADVQTEEEAVDRCRIFGIYEKIENGTKLQDQEIVYEPEELLAIYIRTCMNFLKLLAQNAEVKVMVTVRDLTKRWSTVLTSALQKLGIDRKQIFMQDYLSSFYYYTVHVGRKELWYHDVALIECVDQDDFRVYSSHRSFDASGGSEGGTGCQSEDGCVRAWGNG